VAAARMISIIGRKGAGKTTLLVALAAEFGRRKQRVMTIKDGTTADLGQPGQDDSSRHRHEGKAERVLLEAPEARLLYARTQEESDPISLAQRYLDGADIVLVEGFERAPLPKIEVYRRTVGGAPLFDAATSDSSHWVAMVTDDVAYRATFPVLRFTDTAWLVMLANLAWDRALILTP
jgi:molybdopterin-guanine dinucleotide biosynthesis protein B